MTDQICAHANKQVQQIRVFWGAHALECSFFHLFLIDHAVLRVQYAECIPNFKNIEMSYCGLLLGGGQTAMITVPYCA